MQDQTQFIITSLFHCSHHLMFEEDPEEEEQQQQTGYTDNAELRNLYRIPGSCRYLKHTQICILTYSMHNWVKL